MYELTGSRFFQLPHCPEKPENPPDVPILDILRNWNPDDVAIPARHHSTLCRIDYQADLAKALQYRDADVPFVVYNVPEFDETVRKWAQPGYLEERLGNQPYIVEVSKSNHFLFTTLSTSQQREEQNRSRGPQVPTVDRWPYARWLKEAQKGAEAVPGPESERQRAHYYLRVEHADPSEGSAAIAQDMTIYARGNESSLFLDHDFGPSSRGIVCRFGMRGVVAEAHFDGLRNMVALVGGRRRVLLAHPRFCKHAHLFNRNHTSFRHSRVDWARPDLERYPNFARMRAVEVVLMPGEILHIPTWWLHYFISLEMSAQCNLFSGKSPVGFEHIDACGIGMQYVS